MYPMSSNKFCKENNIGQLNLKSHASTAEMMVRGLQAANFKRLKHEPEKAWYEIIHATLVTLNYIRKS